MPRKKDDHITIKVPKKDMRAVKPSQAILIAPTPDGVWLFVPGCFTIVPLAEKEDDA